jgi:hypothetical protein
MHIPSGTPGHMPSLFCIASVASEVVKTSLKSVVKNDVKMTTGKCIEIFICGDFLAFRARTIRPWGLIKWPSLTIALAHHLTTATGCQVGGRNMGRNVLTYTLPRDKLSGDEMSENETSGGRCYHHNFLRFFPIFGEKIGVFHKYQCYDQLFSKFSFVLSQKRRFFRKIFRRKYF